MKTSSKIAIAAAAVGAWLLAKKKAISGIGAIHYTIKGKVLDVKYRNTSYYGNNSYWVIIETENNMREIVWAYTAANAQLGYTIKNMVGKTVEFDVTQRRDGSIVLNSTTADYDILGNKRK